MEFIEAGFILTRSYFYKIYSRFTKPSLQYKMTSDKKKNSSHGAGSCFLSIFGLHCMQGGQVPPVLSQPGFWGWWPHFWWCSGFYKSQLICLQSQTCCSSGRWWWTGRFWFVPETEGICVSAQHSPNPLSVLVWHTKPSLKLQLQAGNSQVLPQPQVAAPNLCHLLPKLQLITLNIPFYSSLITWAGAM